MKQTDNRQKKQIQMRAASAPKKGGFFGAKRKEKTRIPDSSPKGSDTSQTASAPPALISGETKIGRNEPCPCGSGLKYKKCCLLKSDQEKNKS